MMSHYGKVVVIDDEKSEGQKIVEAAWGAGISVLFAHFDPEVWAKPDGPYRNLTGIRLVFTDIDLLAGGMKGSERQLFGL